MIPLSDDNPVRITPVVTVGLILLNVAVFFYEISLGPGLERFLRLYGAVPAFLIRGGDFSAGPNLPAGVTVMTSMFLHGGFFHLAGNMLYLWIFGNNIEDTLGHVRFILFYVVCGFVAAYAHALTDSASMIPMIGASGAISGVLGAYLILFPHARVLTLVPIFFFIQMVRIPAIFVLGFWFLMQFLSGVLTVGKSVGGVAWFAHIGGFLAGMVLIFLFRKPQGRAGRGWSPR